MNKVIQGEEEFRRVKISRRKLFGIVGVSVSFVFAFLVAWTVLDPYTKQVELYLSPEDNSIIQTQISCGSYFDFWVITALTWKLLLIFSASLLAFLSRNIRQEFNESRTLANMAYMNFTFMLVRILFYLTPVMIQPKTKQGIRSFLLSFESLFSLSIYFIPKFYIIYKLRSEGKLYDKHKDKDLDHWCD